MKKSILILFVLMEFAGFGQRIISGSVVDAETGAALPYVNIGVADKNIGTVSDIEGHFSLEIPSEAVRDLIRFSMLGYEEVTFKSLGEFLKAFPKQKAQVRMKEAPMQLGDVEIAEKSYREKRLGSQTQTKFVIAGFLTDELGSEVAVKIKLGKKKPAWIQEFRFNIAQNPYDSAFFRINVYSLGEDGLPKTNLLEQNNIVIFTERSGLVTVDLKDQLVFVEEDFIIGLEYIRELEPEPEPGEERKKLDLAFSAGFLGNPVYSRQTSQGSWQKTGGINVGFNVLVKY